MTKLLTINFPGQPPLIPSVDVCFYTAMMKPGVHTALAEIVLKEKDFILEISKQPDFIKSPVWLTGRYGSYNFLDLDYEEIRYLKDFVAEEYKNYMSAMGFETAGSYIRMWANELRFQHEITWHTHFDAVSNTDIKPGPCPHVSGNIPIRTNNTQTYFKSSFTLGGGPKAQRDIVGIDNIDGECLFFPSWVNHKTAKNETTISRITISFDIIPENVYLAKKDNEHFRKLT